MLDSVLRPLIDPPLNKIASILSSKTPITGIQMTLIGFGFGIFACFFALLSLYSLALLCLIINRICDGLDGPIARTKNQSSDFGGFLDITLDYVIYAGFPLTIGLGMMSLASLSASAFVIFGMICSGISFLAYAIVAGKRGLETEAQGKKTFFFSTGLLEGTETILFLFSLCLFPDYFEILCFVFGFLCILTGGFRIQMAYQVFK
jgi:phosphatidylglycerophosphate synthase